MKLSIELSEQDILNALAAAVNARLGDGAKIARWNMRAQHYNRAKQWVALRSLRVVAIRMVEVQP